MRRLMDLKVDFAFKQVFGRKGNERILTAFLNAMLDLPAERRIRAVELLNSEIFREHIEDKSSRLDIVAETETGVRINIEIQLTNKYDMINRTLYYWARMFAAQLSKGRPYTELAKTITINILNFHLLEQTEEFHSCFQLYERRKKFPLTDVMEIHIVELPKLMVQWRKGQVSSREDALVRWLLLLEAGEHEEIRKELEVIAMQDPAMKDAFLQWEELSLDKKTWAEYWARHKTFMDEFSAQKEAEIRERRAGERGLEQGATQAMEKIARNLLARGLDIVFIAESVGMSVEQVEELKKQLS